MCRQLEFCEQTLCDLNRSVQGEADFECHAFRPLLRDAASSIDEATVQEDISMEINSENLLDSDRFKYAKAMALQKLKHDPDAEICSLKYHMVWNVASRKAVFKDTVLNFDMIGKAFEISGEKTDCFTTLLQVAPNHVHLYLESDGDKSIDSIISELKKLTKKELINKTTGLKDRLDGRNRL